MRNDELNSKLQRKLDNLKQVPERNPHTVARGKADFLRQAVSMNADRQKRGWVNNLISTFSFKERFPVLKPVLAFILIIAILFGGTAATVYAAQGSMPDQPLYPVKTWSEDLLLAVTRSSQAQLEQNLNFADLRILEIAYLQAANIPIPQVVQTRLQTELNQVLHLAAELDDQQMIKELERIHLRVEAQLQMLSTLMAGDQDPPDPVMQKVQTSLQQQLQMAAKGITNTKGFRNELQNQIQDNEKAPSELPGFGQDNPDFSHTTTPGQSGQQQDDDGSSSDGGEGPNYNYLTITPFQNGPYYGQKTPTPAGNKKP